MIPEYEKIPPAVLSALVSAQSVIEKVLEDRVTIIIFMHWSFSVQCKTLIILIFIRGVTLQIL